MVEPIECTINTDGGWQLMNGNCFLCLTLVCMNVLLVCDPLLCVLHDDGDDRIRLMAEGDMYYAYISQAKLCMQWHEKAL